MARGSSDASRSSSALPLGHLPPWRQALRYQLGRSVVWVLARLLFRVRLVDGDRIGRDPAVLCFNHLGWLDPMILLAAFPRRPRLYFYGPKEEDMGRGGRNRLMAWLGVAVPYRPAKDDLITSVRRAQAVFDSGSILAIAGEGRIHVHEGDLMALQEGAAYLSLRGRVPIIPIALTGTSWVGFRRTVTVRVGEPIATGERPNRETVDRYTAATWHALRAMVAHDRDLPEPGPFGRWLTDLFNDWGPGGREAATAEWGPRPEDVRQPGRAPVEEAAGAG